MNIGGANILTIDTASMLNKEIFEVTIISLTENEKLKSLLPNDVNLKFLNLKTYKRFKKLSILAQYLYEYDILHPVLENSMLLTSLTKLFYLRKICLITTVHGIDSPLYIKDKLLKEFISKNWSLKYLLISKYLQKFLFRTYNLVIAVSESTGSYLINKRKIPRGKIKVIYHGINVSKFLHQNEVESSEIIRQRFGFDKTDFVVGYIGRLTYAKGLEYMIDQIKSLNESNENIKFFFVGDGEIKDLIKQKIKLYNLEYICKLTEFVFNTKDYFNCIDLLILPSFSEGIPLSLLESMLLKKITLSSNVGGIPEVIENKVNGFLFEQGNFIQMAEEINFIINSKTHFDDLKENAYKTILQKFDLNKNIKIIEKVLNDEYSKKYKR